MDQALGRVETGEPGIGADSDESGHPFRWKAATLSERSDEQGSWLIEVAALVTSGGSGFCHVV
ncbi:MAG TPA: hypothetical protein VHR45_09240, partial [Thermoanaerobaculia bacterium]|nr:hypothetical protein [Thermoanaerobaculia bacterium]